MDESVARLIIINFGINPNKGGKPPKDIKIKGIINFQSLFEKFVDEGSLRLCVSILDNINIRTSK